MSSCTFQCNSGWYGVDCGIPSVESSAVDWPLWLRPAQVDVPDNLQFAGKVANLNAVVKKKRPLIYIYDLPPRFNSLLLEVSMNLIVISIIPCKSKSFICLYGFL